MASIVIAMGLKLDFNWERMWDFLQSPYIMLGTPLMVILGYWIAGMYAKVWRYVGTHELMVLTVSTALSYVPLQVAVMPAGGSVFPRSGPVLCFIVTLAICGGVRFLLRLFSEALGKDANAIRIFVIGANDVGESLIRELKRAHASHTVVGILDDDLKKRGLRIRGVRVLGGIEELPELSKKYGIEEAILCNATALQARAITEMKGLHIRIRRLPTINEIVEGAVKVDTLPPLSIEDLLERPPVRMDMTEVGALLQNKVVLITGAGGSIGSEIARQVWRFGPKRLVLLGRGENSLHEIRQEIPQAKVVICDVTRADVVQRAVAQFRPAVVFHAAAHKHVRYMEDHPCEAIRNNVLGTLNMVLACRQIGVERFVLLSTDKAVNPTSVMGATKRLAEAVVLQHGGRGFVAVRFGNVLGSRGSVVPIFRRQIAAGGPVTVSDPDATRYFMTIPEAVRLVLEASTLGQQGEVYILDMGQPIKIDDLAKNLIRLSGYEPNKDIPIVYTGLSAGEKSYEELVNDGEETAATSVPKISKVVHRQGDLLSEQRLADLRNACDSGDDAQARQLLKEYLPNSNLN